MVFMIDYRFMILKFGIEFITDDRFTRLLRLTSLVRYCSVLGTFLFISSLASVISAAAVVNLNDKRVC